MSPQLSKENPHLSPSKERTGRKEDSKTGIPKTNSRVSENDDSTDGYTSDTNEEGGSDNKATKEVHFNMIDTNAFLGYNTYGDIHYKYSIDDDIIFGQLILIEDDIEMMHEEDQSVGGVMSLVDVFDRDNYIQDYFVQLRRNFYLKRETERWHKLMAIHFKKKKLDHVLQEVNPFHKPELLKKYEAVLIRYDELKYAEETTRLREQKEIDTMIEVRRQKLDQFKKDFGHLLHRAKEIGLGLKSYRTGQIISNEIVKRRINLQFDALKKLSRARVAYIKEKNALAAQNEKMRNLENIGPGLTIDDYQQLLLAKKIITDKIQERNSELDNCRQKLVEKYQILRHVQEKLVIAYEDVKYHNSHVENLAENVAYLRERISELCQERDQIRRKIAATKKKHYLMFHKNLSSDMYKTGKQIIKLQAELDSIKETYNINAEKLKAWNTKRKVNKALEMSLSESQIPTILPKILNKHEKEKYKKRNMLLEKECQVTLKEEVEKIPTDSEMFFDISVTSLSNINLIINSSQAG